MKVSKLTQKEIKNKIAVLDPLSALKELFRIRDSQEANVDKLIIEYKKKLKHLNRK